MTAMMKKKILQLQSSSGFYGAENMLAQLALALQGSAYTPVIGVINNTGDPHLELIDFAERHGIERRIFPCRSVLDRSTIRDLNDYIGAEEISLVQTHGYKSDFYAVAATRGTKAARLGTCHPWIVNSGRGRFYAAVDRRILRRFHHLAAVSDSVYSDLLRAGLPAGKITIIPNGIDIRPFRRIVDRGAILQGYGLAPESRVIGCVGRLDPEKGQHLLLEACSRLLMEDERLVLLLAGNGSLASALKSEAQRLGIAGRVLFPGFVEAVPELLAVLDLFVMPSWTEGAPMALLEAMAAGCAIVATRVGQIPDMLEEGKAGLLVTPGDRTGMEEAVRMLCQNRRMADEFGRAAAQKAAADYSAETMAGRYRRLYDQLIASPPAA